MNCCYIINDYKLELNNEKINGCEPYELSNKYTNMLIMSVKTLLLFYDTHIDKIYILCDKSNISIKNYTYMYNEIVLLNSLYNNKIIIQEIDVNSLFANNIIKYPINNVNQFKIGKIALVKFLLPYLIKEKDLFYIDCDILFNGNIYDILIKDIKNNTLFKFYSDTQHCSVNSGLIYINCELYKQYNVLEKVIMYYDNYQNIELVDNSCFQMLYKIYKDISLININYNRKKYFINYTLLNPEKLNAKYAIIHIKGIPKNRYELFEILYNKIYNK